MIYEDFLNLLKNMIEDQAEAFTGDRTTGYNPGCNDIPGGFQDINPILFTAIGEVLGAIISNKLPLNVQNAFGNWLELLGQVILTYSAQQQYFQAGPGRYYDVRNRNITNPFCPEATSQGAGSEPETTSTADNQSNNYDNEIKQMKQKIHNLNTEIENLKLEIANMKNSKV